MKGIFSTIVTVFGSAACLLAVNSASAIEFLPNSKFDPKVGSVMTISRTSGMDLSGNTGCAEGVDDGNNQWIELCYTQSGASTVNQVILEVRFFSPGSYYSKKVNFDFVGWSKLYRALGQSTTNCPTRIKTVEVDTNVLVPSKVFSGCQ
jgi:hypothetical protein